MASVIFKDIEKTKSPSFHKIAEISLITDFIDLRDDDNKTLRYSDFREGEDNLSYFN